MEMFGPVISQQVGLQSDTQQWMVGLKPDLHTLRAAPTGLLIQGISSITPSFCTGMRSALLTPSMRAALLAT